MFRDWYEADKYVPENGTQVLVCNCDGKIETGYYSEEPDDICFITPSGFPSAASGVYWAFIPDPPNRITRQSRIVRCRIPIIYRTEDDIYGN